MTVNEIPSLTDKEWASKNELGTITRILEYNTGTGTEKAKVSVTAQIISGEEIEAIEAVCSTIDFATQEVDIDREKFTMMRFCRTFGIDEDTYKDIMKNKSEDLRNQMMLLVAEITGSNLSEEEIAKQKNLESPVS